jgi:hypothetical protein
MGPNIALDIAVLQTFDAVHACLSGGAADLRKTWIFRAETGSTCDRVGVSGAAGGPAGHSENRLRLRRNSRKELRCTATYPGAAASMRLPEFSYFSRMKIAKKFLWT